MLFTVKRERKKKKENKSKKKKNTQFTTKREYTYICEQDTPFAGKTKK